MKRLGYLNLIFCFMLLASLSCKKKPTEPTGPTLHELVQKMSGKRTWHGTEVDDAGTNSETTYYITTERILTVLNDTTINMDSVCLRSTLAESYANRKLYLDSWDKPAKKIVFYWKAISYASSELTYYYLNDSITFRYGVGNPGGDIDLNLHTP